jgi:hypothetical protein
MADDGKSGPLARDRARCRNDCPFRRTRAGRTNRRVCREEQCELLSRLYRDGRLRVHVRHARAAGDGADRNDD